MDQQQRRESLYLRRQFFKKVLGASSVAALSTLAGLTLPDLAHASSIRPHQSLTSNLAPFYRLYNPGNGDHFYTTDRGEANNAIRHLGYNDEGIACYVLASMFTGIAPLYRLYNPRTGDHFYTINQMEANNAALHLGYHREGIACYIFPPGIRNVPFSVPFYRLYNPRTGDHFYTTDQSEADNAIRYLGYHDEGIACYVL
jgi:hypothetical protein